MKIDKLLIFACVFAAIGIFYFNQSNFALAENNESTDESLLQEPLQPSVSTDPVYQPSKSIEPLDVSVPMQVSSPASIELVSFEPFRTEAFAFAAGTSIEALEDFFRDINMGLTAYDEAGTSFVLDTSSWDLTGINTDSTGIYYSVTSPILDGYTLAEGLSIPQISVPVSIQETGKPEINLYYSGRGYLLFPWVITENQIDNISVYLYENGNWRLLSENDGMTITDSVLYLTTNLFTLGEDYKLQAEYPGGKTKILSFTYDSSLNIKDYSTGDRDGGDGNNNHLEDQIQNAPSHRRHKSHHESSPSQESEQKPEQEPKEEPEQELKQEPDKVQPVLSNSENNQSAMSIVFASDKDLENTILTPSATMSVAADIKNPSKEFFGKNQDMISWTRLRMMFENGGGTAQFSKHGILVSLQKSNFVNLGLKDFDTFTITINKASESEFSISAKLNENPVTELSGTKIMIPYKKIQADSFIHLTDGYDNRICDGVYDSNLSVVSFTVNHTGSFRIIETSSADNSKVITKSSISNFTVSSDVVNKQSVVPLAACTSFGIATAGAGSVFFLKRRKFK